MTRLISILTFIRNNILLLFSTTTIEISDYASLSHKSNIFKKPIKTKTNYE